MWEFRPFSISEEDRVQPALTAIYAYTEGNNLWSGDYREEFYLSIDYNDPDDGVIKYLESRHPGIIIHNGSENTKYVECQEGAIFYNAPRFKCKAGKILSANLVRMLMWRVALVNVHSPNCGGDAWMFKPFNRWIIFSMDIGCS